MLSGMEMMRKIIKHQMELVGYLEGSFTKPKSNEIEGRKREIHEGIYE